MNLKNFIQCAAAAALLVGIAMPTFAQKKSKSDGAAPAFDKGSKTLGLGVGLGASYGTFLYRTVSLPLIFATYDQGIIGNVGPGTIGIGGIVGFKSSSYKYGSGLGRYGYSNFFLGARGTYHLTILKDKNNKFDPYAGVTVGLRVWNWNDSYWNSKDGGVAPMGGAFIGAKYNFKPGFGVFAEAGYDISFLRAGINFNF